MDHDFCLREILPGWKREAMRLCPAWILLFAVGLGCLASSSFAQEPAAPIGTGLQLDRNDILIFSGVAGDQASRDQDGLIAGDLLARLPVVEGRRIHLLTEGRVPIPGGLQVERGEPTLAGLKNAATAVAGRGLTAFVWGHGGLLGGQPVLHVRGPRVGVPDLIAVANAANPGSAWVLAFCGSGRFGVALMGKDRRVLTSDGETVYGSDPVLMRFVADALEEGGTGFDGFVARVGNRVLGWYEERSLVVQEQPWFGSGEGSGGEWRPVGKK
ncbi:MAG: hypothetical protein RLZZ253_430 [Verrucomicrobiota bacterium]|jgi:hypothetical protein